VKVAVLISGRGSNLHSLIQASNEPKSGFEIILVISNKRNALGLEKAKEVGIPIEIIDHRNFSNRESFDNKITEFIESINVELICLAGFMRILSESFINRWYDQIINIHPSKLPAFKGLNVHKRVIDAGEKNSGCTVHFVRNKMDTGPIICQASVPVYANDDVESLSSRILKKEHIIYPQAVKLIAQGRVAVNGEYTLIDGKNIFPKNC